MVSQEILLNGSFDKWSDRGIQLMKIILQPEFSQKWNLYK